MKIHYLTFDLDLWSHTRLYSTLYIIGPMHRHSLKRLSPTVLATHLQEIHYLSFDLEFTKMLPGALYFM